MSSKIAPPTYNVASVDIFGSLTLEKKAVKARLAAKKEAEAAKNPEKAVSKAGKLQSNQTNIVQDYSQRKSRGQ